MIAATAGAIATAARISRNVARVRRERKSSTVRAISKRVAHATCAAPAVGFGAIEDLAGQGVTRVVLVPIGFVSDHMEVIYDLDTEALATAAAAGVKAVRAATPGVDARFVSVVRELLLERAAAERGERPERATWGTAGPATDRCAVGCCPNPRAELPALGGLDDVTAR